MLLPNVAQHGINPSADGSRFGSPGNGVRRANLRQLGFAHPLTHQALGDVPIGRRVDIHPRHALQVDCSKLTTRNELAQSFMERPRDWRSWSFRAERLEQYLTAKVADWPDANTRGPYLR